MPVLSQGDAVRVRVDGQKDWTNQGTIQGSFSTPRSYVVETSEGKLIRRNRRHLQKEHTPSATPEYTVDPEGMDLMDSKGISTHTQTQDIPTLTQNTPTQTHTDLTDTTSSGQVQQSQSATVTRSGRVCKPVQRLNL